MSFLQLVALGGGELLFTATRHRARAVDALARGVADHFLSVLAQPARPASQHRDTAAATPRCCGARRRESKPNSRSRRQVEEVQRVRLQTARSASKRRIFSASGEPALRRPRDRVPCTPRVVAHGQMRTGAAPSPALPVRRPWMNFSNARTRRCAAAPAGRGRPRPSAAVTLPWPRPAKRLDDHAAQLLGRAGFPAGKVLMAAGLPAQS